MDTLSKLSTCLRANLFIPLLIIIITTRNTIDSQALEHNFNLYILHTNDIHSRFETFNRKEIACKVDPSTKVTKKCFGGIVRRAGFVNQFRREHKNVLLLDAGDQFQGTPWFYTYKGVEASHFLNRLRYDAMALGNHEFDNGVKGLIPFLKNVTVPILCSNLVRDEHVPIDIINSVKEHMILELDGRKIGIIGYITDTVPLLSKTGNLSFRSEKETLSRDIEVLKGKGVNIIIALGHSGLKKDKEMATELPDVDLIVGGHSHSLLYTGKNPQSDEVSGDYPLVYRHKNNHTTLVVQAGSFGKYVGMLNLTFDPKGKVIQWSGNPVVMDEKVPEDDEVKEEMEMLYVKVDEKFNFVVGRSEIALDASENICRISECNIGNLVTDSMVHFVIDMDRWKHLSIALINGGSLRASLQEGDITYGDVLTIWPFCENLIIIQINGSELLNLFEHSVSGFDLTERKGKFLQFSGLIVTYDLHQPDGHKVVQVKVRDCYMCSGYKDLELGKVYDVIAQSYLLGGGDGYTMLKNYKETSIPVDIQSTETLIKYLELHSPVNPKVEGRIKGLESYPGLREAIDRRTSNDTPRLTSLPCLIGSLSSLTLLLKLKLLI